MVPKGRMYNQSCKELCVATINEPCLFLCQSHPKGHQETLPMLKSSLSLLFSDEKSCHISISLLNNHPDESQIDFRKINIGPLYMLFGFSALKIGTMPYCHL
ncbi:hypothetical protein BS78_06G064200 [Paspalum vaginatum]|nr:hypothetical protein BS78_06G064200 [Paspalum vaginatum]